MFTIISTFRSRATYATRSVPEESVEGVITEASGQQASWRPPVLKTSALRSEGIEELIAAIEEHWRYQSASGVRQHRERARAADELHRILRQDLLARLLDRIAEPDLEETVGRIVARKEDPYSAARRLIVTSGLAEESECACS